VVDEYTVNNDKDGCNRLGRAHTSVCSVYTLRTNGRRGSVSNRTSPENSQKGYLEKSREVTVLQEPGRFDRQP